MKSALTGILSGSWCGTRRYSCERSLACSNKRPALKSQDNTLTASSSCIYHPAPLTKVRTSSDERAESVPPLPASSNRASPYPSRFQQPAAPISPSSIQEESSGYSSVPSRSVQPSPMLPMTLGTAHGRQMSSTISHKSPDNFTSSFRNDRTGFLGPTAYSAVFTENSGKQTMQSCRDFAAT